MLRFLIFLILSKTARIKSTLRFVLLAFSFLGTSWLLLGLSDRFGNHCYLAIIDSCNRSFFCIVVGLSSDFLFFLLHKAAPMGG